MGEDEHLVPDEFRAACGRPGTEFRAACGRPGTHVVVRHFPVTVPHAVCDLTGVALSYPGHGGATVPTEPCSIANSLGFRLTVHPETLDVTVNVQLQPGAPS